MTSAQLKAARLVLDMSQGELAGELGVTERAVRRWENEERAVPPLLERDAALTVLRLHEALRPSGKKR